MAINPIYAIQGRDRRSTLLPYKQGLDDGSTLSLDFTTGVLDPRLTFTRSSDATFINSQGLVQFADANLLQRSQDYTVAAWSKFRIDTTTSGLNTANTTTAPDGTSTGLLLKSDGVSGTHRVLQSNGTTGSTALSTNGLSTVTLSAYFKANGSNFCSLKVSNNIESRGVTRNFNLTNGVVSGAEDVGWTPVSASASPVGNGWYRCQMTVSLTRVDANDDQMGIWLWVANGPDVADRSFTNSAASVWVWGAQVSIGANALEYRATTTAPYQAPRFDYDPTTLAPRGLLVEGQSENLCQQGQYCWGTGATNTWARSAEVHVNAVNGTAGASAIARIDGPDGGSLTGTSLFKQAGTATFVRTNINVAVAQSTTYTFSAYVRSPSSGINPYIRLAAFNGGTWLNTTGGTTASGITITDTAGSGSRFNGVSSTAWVRIWVTFTTQVGQTAATIAFYPDTDTQNAATMYVWGAQVEAGSGPSSVILTGASQGTRTLDLCYIAGSNFTSWFSTGAGTVVAHSDNVCIPASGSQNLVGNFSDSTTNNYIRMGYRVGGGTNELLLTAVGGSIQGGPDSGFNPALNTAYKSAYAWDINNFACCANGGSVVTDTSGTLAGSGVITSLTIGGDFYQTSGPNSIYMKNGHIRSFKYWPTRLPNAQLQSLTT